MANESFLSVPTNVEDPMVLRRFLARLLEQLDIAFGNRGGQDTSYVEQKTLIASADSLSSQLEAAQRTLDDAIKALAETLGEDTEDILTQLDELSNELQLLTDRVQAAERYTAIKSLFVSFTVDGSNVIQPNFTYNVSTNATISTGVYEFTLAQTTYFSQNVLDNTVFCVDRLIAPAATSESFDVEVEILAGKVRLKVYEITLNGSNVLVRTPYDLQPGDTLHLTGLFNRTDSVLPGV